MTYLIIGASILGLILILVVVIALQPNEFRISRSAVMPSSPAKAFALVNDFHHWTGWSPWLSLDPAATTTYDGPTSGVGASFSWKGNQKIGAGTMTICESRADEHIGINLVFREPFANTAVATFTFRVVDQQTLVTWSMVGRCTFITKAIHLVGGMERMVGGQFEKGLASMRGLLSST
jgi:hypothetical protein